MPSDKDPRGVEGIVASVTKDAQRIALYERFKTAELNWRDAQGTHREVKCRLEFESAMADYNRFVTKDGAEV